MINSHSMTVGDVVSLLRPVLGEPAYTQAVVYHTYPAFDADGTGISLITENGVDLGGFSPKEQHAFWKW